MSAAVETYRDDLEATYAVDFSRSREPIASRKRFPEYRRKGGAPTRVSGMHCRRSKRWTWGSGRSARMLNMRAFAGAVAFAVASVASSVLGVTMDMVTIGNPGNPNNPASSLGAVSTIFQLSKYETTNAQYVAFLNAVGASNPNGIFNVNMGTDPLGGIVQTGASGSFQYAVKGGTNPQGRPYADLPVNFVTWFSAARFINWLENGQQANPALIETGAYTLNNATGGPLPSRNPGATYFMPSLNEWYKAAFHNEQLGGSNYYDWGLANNTKPANDVSNLSLTNAANYGGVATPTLGPIEIGSYAGSSSYGLYDMMGNIAEMTDTVGNTANRYLAVSGSYATQLPQMDGFSALYVPSNVGGGAATGQIGFRVAAVPEPGTFALAGVGITGLAGYEWSRRRKAKAAALAA